MKHIIACMVFLTMTIYAANNSAPSLLRIETENPDDIKQFYEMDLDVTHISSESGIVEAILTYEQQKELQNLGFSFDTVIDDLNGFYDELRNSNYFKHFHSIQQIEALMDSLENAYPDLVRIFDIGDSYNKVAYNKGFDILAMKISDDVSVEDSTEADVLYTAAIHAREIVTPEVLIVFIDYLLNGYGTNAFATHLINNRELWFILCVNPDGRDYVFTGDYGGIYSTSNPILWRKNMHDNDGNGIFNPDKDGVDLNRNFGFSWAFNDVGSSPNMNSESYRGLAPFSEPETWAIKEFVEAHDFVISLFYHSYGNLWLYPWGFKPENPEEPDYSAFLALNDSCVAYNGYTPDNGVTNKLGYLANGSSDDWLYGEQGIFAITPEVGLSVQGGFWPDTTEIDFMCYENLGANLFMAWAAGEEPEIMDYSYSTFKHPADDYTILASINPPVLLTDPVALDTASFKVHYRYGKSGAFDSLDVEYIVPIDRYQAKIPGNEYSGVIQYYISATDSMGRKGTWPRGAPMAVDSLEIDFPLAIDNTGKDVNSWELYDNYPNPFNSNTVISFSLADAGEVNLTIYNTLGQEVIRLAGGKYAAGAYRKVWDGRDRFGSRVPSGVYFYELTGNGFHKLKKMVYIQ